jgi:hypothetical protein
MNELETAGDSVGIASAHTKQRRPGKKILRKPLSISSGMRNQAVPSLQAAAVPILSRSRSLLMSPSAGEVTCVTPDFEDTGNRLQPTQQQESPRRSCRCG